MFPFYFRYWGHTNNIFILPLLFNFRWSETEYHHLMIPLVTYFGKTSYDSTKLILGTYWYSSKSYERQNFWFLYDHWRYNSSNSETYGFLFHSVRYDENPELTRIRLFWGGLMSWKNYKNSPHYDHYFALGLVGWENSRSYYRSYVMPFYYYKSYHDAERGWYLLVPPALSYFSRDKKGDFDLGLLGLAYYRNNNIPEKEDRRMVLLGSIFNEVRRPERGYHAYGSLWGFLWEFEEESETDFEKLTVLKGLIYKKVKYKGEEKVRIFGI